MNDAVIDMQGLTKVFLTDEVSPDRPGAVSPPYCRSSDCSIVRRQVHMN